MADVTVTAEKTERIDRARRALLRAGWMVPVLLTVKIPLDALAQYQDPKAPPEVTDPGKP